MKEVEGGGDNNFNLTDYLIIYRPKYITLTIVGFNPNSTVITLIRTSRGRDVTKNRFER